MPFKETGPVKLTISAEAHQAIQQIHDPLKDGEWNESGEELPDGRWKIKLSAETFERLAEKMLHGETPSETILRICSTAGRPAN